MEIDYPQFFLSYVRLSNHAMRMRTASERTEANSRSLETHSRAFFSAVAEVIICLDDQLALPFSKTVLPGSFSIRPTSLGNHLTISRSGAHYDGRYYAIDRLKEDEDLGTYVDAATIRDLATAIDRFLPLLECIIQSNRKRNPRITPD